MLMFVSSRPLSQRRGLSIHTAWAACRTFSYEPVRATGVNFAPQN
jgi:hypothetical protein